MRLFVVGGWAGGHVDPTVVGSKDVRMFLSSCAFLKDGEMMLFT